jgi:HrpA-like RNA helicase
VPQFILDDDTAGPRCMIACTQPRRISAASVAERIADERCEQPGHIVGYTIRLEAVMSNTVQASSVCLFSVYWRCVAC